jgi:hypothetical protein
VAITLIRDLFRDHLTQLVGQAILFSPVCQQEIPR